MEKEVFCKKNFEKFCKNIQRNNLPSERHAYNFVKKRPQHSCSRTSRSQMLYKTVVHEKFTKFTGRHLCWSLRSFRFLTCNIILFWSERCFSVNFAKFLKTSFRQNTSRLLLLVFTCDFWVFQDNLFIEHLQETTYFIFKLQDSSRYIH